MVTPESKALQAKRKRLWTLFRITPEEETLIEAFQRSHPELKLLLGKHMGVDHRHSDGFIRGRLEWRINRAYGMLEQVCPTNLPALLHALALYHEHPPAEQALGEKRYGLIGQAKMKKKMLYGPPATETRKVSKRSSKKS